MPSSLLTPAVTEANSDPVTLGVAESATLFLTGPGASAATVGLVSIQLQTVDGGWVDAYAMNSPEHRTARLSGPITFRVHRQFGGSGALAVGVERY